MSYLLKLLGDPAFDVPGSTDEVPKLPPFEVIERQTTGPMTL
jgi:hypothetical protein